GLQTPLPPSFNLFDFRHFNPLLLPWFSVRFSVLPFLGPFPRIFVSRRSTCRNCSVYRYHHFLSSGNLLPERYVAIQVAQNLRIVCNCEEFYHFLKDEFLPRSEKLISHGVIDVFQFSSQSLS